MGKSGGEEGGTEGNGKVEYKNNQILLTKPFPIHFPVNIPGAHNLPTPNQHDEILASIDSRIKNSFIIRTLISSAARRRRMYGFESCWCSGVSGHLAEFVNVI